MDINNVNLIGRLVRDPELKILEGDKQLCKFSIAVNDMKDKVSYVDITTWNKTATNCSTYLKKGSQVAINGKLTQSAWKDKDGNNRSKLEVMGLQVQFIGAKSDSSKPPQDIGFSEVPENESDQLVDDEVPF